MRKTNVVSQPVSFVSLRLLRAKDAAQALHQHVCVEVCAALRIELVCVICLKDEPRYAPCRIASTLLGRALRAAAARRARHKARGHREGFDARRHAATLLHKAVYVDGISCAKYRVIAGIDSQQGGDPGKELVGPELVAIGE